jgi:hypothetical protein
MASLSDGGIARVVDHSERNRPHDAHEPEGVGISIVVTNWETGLLKK